jgi:hypothetical protein
MDDLFLDRTLPELRTLIEAIEVVATDHETADPEIAELVELCALIMARRGSLPLVEYLRVLAK